MVMLCAMLLTLVVTGSFAVFITGGEKGVRFTLIAMAAFVVAMTITSHIQH